MERRTFIKSATSASALLLAGCLGGSAPSGSEGESTTETTTTPEPTPAPESDITFRTEGDVLRAVHMGGDQIEAESTTEVYVTVDGERTLTWTDDSDETQSYPVSVGNFLEIPSAKSGSTVEVVWVGAAENEAVLATYEVPAAETTTATETTTTTTETTTAANETTTTDATTTTKTNESA